MLAPGADMGNDGVANAAGNMRARDVYGYALHYYDKTEYDPIGGVNTFASLDALTSYKPLYNGNIAAMAVSNPYAGSATGAATPMLYAYNYDQLNRLTKQLAYTGLNNAQNRWVPVASNNYRETISYDANGNIQKYNRYANPAIMDSLTYTYKAGKNQLDYIDDKVADAAFTVDIDKQNAGNYTYDEIGNLKTDTKEGITAIDWNVYGKINSITKAGTTINYTYDASGNRISKAVTTGGNTVTTWYARDASGNVMSVYVKGDAAINSGQLTVTETHLYGSSRIGMTTPNLNVQNPVAFASLAVTGFATGYFVNFERGKKFFELTNHLGNVLATISDKKIGTANGSNVNYYSAEIVSANDYYPFGMQAVGRTYSASKYRYGFNGQEKDNEVYGEGNIMAAQFWEYDTRIGKRWNLDPMTKPEISSYATFSNNPIINIDPHGDSDSSVTSPNGNSFTLPESARITKNSFSYTNSNGVEYQHTTGAVESFEWNDLTYSANYNSKTGEFTGYKAQLDAAHGNQKLNFSYGHFDMLMERIKAMNSEPPSNPIDQYRAWRSYGGYHSGESWGDRVSRNINNSHIEEMLDFGGGGYNMWGGYGGIANGGKFINLASVERTTHIIAGDATGGGHAWFGSLKSFMNGLTRQKTMFPMTWSNGKIMNAVSDVTVNNPWIQQTGRAGAAFTKAGDPVRFTVQGTYQGLNIKVVTTASDIITAHPIR